MSQYYFEEENERVRWAMEQLHGAVNTDAKDVEELLGRFRKIMEAATHPMRPTSCAKGTRKRADS